MTRIAAAYRIANTDSEATRKQKAYSWIIDNQIARVMPNAKPVPNSTTTASYNYWSAYLDYLISSVTISGSTASNGMPRRSSTASVTVPSGRSIASGSVKLRRKLP